MIFKIDAMTDSENTSSLDGEMTNGHHVMTIRVYYEDTDFTDLPLS